MWMWIVYPSSSTDQPITATGISDEENKARTIVEFVLSVSGEHAFGMVVAADLHRDVCRHTRDGGLAWRDAFSLDQVRP